MHSLAFSAHALRQPVLLRPSRLHVPQPSSGASQRHSTGRGGLLACCAALINGLIREEGPRKPKRKAKKARDPERPKRPPNAYLLFLAEWRKRRRTPFEQKEATRQASQAWNELSDEDKAAWKKEFAKKNEVYKQEMQEYIDSGKADYWARDPIKPKRPPPPMYLYMNDHLDQVKHRIGRGRVVNVMAELWKEAPKKTQEAYKKKYKELNHQWSKDLDEYKKTGAQDRWKHKVGLDKERLRRAKEEERERRMRKAKKRLEAKREFYKKVRQQKMKRKLQEKKDLAAKKKQDAILRLRAQKLQPISPLELQTKVNALAGNALAADDDSLSEEVADLPPKERAPKAQAKPKAKAKSRAR